MIYLAKHLTSVVATCLKFRVPAPALDAGSHIVALHSKGVDQMDVHRPASSHCFPNSLAEQL